jgi:protein-S-isoprenylcysteine O-methyltransferase Ste14
MKRMMVAEAIESPVAPPGAVGLDLAHVGIGRDAGAPSRDVADTFARFALVALFSFMAIRLGANFLETGRLTGLLLLASEALVVVLTAFRRAPMIVDRSARARMLTTLAMAGPPLVAPTGLQSLVPDAISATVGALGLLVAIGGKLSLGRSFGLIPANRGIVSTGLYRVVRHPIYLGYLITHVAFLAAHPTVWNFVLLLGADIALLARAVCEEETLARDDAYVAYQAQVRWRVVPGLF